MKTLKEFRATKWEGTPEEYAEKYHQSNEDIRTSKVIAYGESGWFIEKSDDDKYLVLVERTDHVCLSLAKAEEILWDEFVKHQLDLSAQDLEDDLHERAVDFMNDLGIRSVSLDDLLAGVDDFEFQEEEDKFQAMYLMQKFEEVPQDKPSAVVQAINLMRGGTPDFIINMDWEIFKEQRQMLIDFEADNMCDIDGREIVLEVMETEKFRGLIGLCDAIVDYAVDICGIPEDQVIIKE